MSWTRIASGFGAVVAVGVVLAGCSSDAQDSTAVPTQEQGDSVPSFPPVPANAALTLVTNEGTIQIAMDPAAEVTQASMASLAGQGFFNGTSCHRLTTDGIYVLQCGDPEGTGMGGPGYEIPDENLPDATPNNYPKGTVAMANAGPNTNGSQFFIVYQDTTLSPNYTIWGSVVSGLDVVERVAAAGVEGGGTDGPPALPVTIETATVAAS